MFRCNAEDELTEGRDNRNTPLTVIANGNHVCALHDPVLTSEIEAHRLKWNVYGSDRPGNARERNAMTEAEIFVKCGASWGLASGLRTRSPNKQILLWER
jgi:hypothetical protein